MSLGLLGCNPDHRWTVEHEGTASQRIVGDNPTSAVALGTIGYSPSGQMCVCVQADGALGKNKLVAIEHGWQADLQDDATIASGVRMGATTDDFADNEYGWVVIWGDADLTAGGTITAGANLCLDATEDGDVVPNTGNTAAKCVGVQANEAIADNAVGSCQLTFPVYITNS